MPAPLNDSELRAAARRTLQLNDHGTFTTPSPGQYPHQWNWDAALIALGWAHFDRTRARTEIRSLLRAQWRDGMLPHIIYHQGASDYFPPPAFWQTEGLPHGGAVLSSGLTQPPVVATVVRRLYERYPDPDMLSFVRELFPKIRAWHRWLHLTRSIDDSGLPCLIHPWESGTDNSPRWIAVLERLEPHDLPEYTRRDTRHVQVHERPRPEDYERYVFLIDQGRRVGWDPARLLTGHPFLVQDVLFCSILYRADQDLLALARTLGEDTNEIEQYLADARAGFDARFWNDARGLYLDYDVRARESIPVNTLATFMPLYAGLAAPAQAQRLLSEHWNNPVEYAPAADSRYILPSTAKNEPHYDPRRYWCGPVWVITNWFLADGMNQYGMHQVAAQLRADSLELVRAHGFREYYDPRDGTGAGAADFSWSAALTLEFLDEP